MFRQQYRGQFIKRGPLPCIAQTRKSALMAYREYGFPEFEQLFGARRATATRSVANPGRHGFGLQFPPDRVHEFRGIAEDRIDRDAIQPGQEDHTHV